jgi:hypothetical protein
LPFVKLVNFPRGGQSTLEIRRVSAMGHGSLGEDKIEPACHREAFELNTNLFSRLFNYAKIVRVFEMA